MTARHPQDSSAPEPAPAGGASSSDLSSMLGVLPTQLVRNTTRLGWTSATAIQAAAIEPILAGRDVLGLARTGSGKTGAFLLPVGALLLRRSAAERVGSAPEASRRRRASPPSRQPGVLVLCPTRELALQVASDADELFRGTRLVVRCIHGKVSLGPQIAALAEGVDVLVATPGRALELLQSGALRLTALRSVVLDEADRMLDMGLGPQVRAILEATPPDRQTVLFSATMPTGPTGVHALAASVLRDPVRLEIDSSGTVATHVKQRAFEVDDARKTPLLLSLIGHARLEATGATEDSRSRRGGGGDGSSVASSPAPRDASDDSARSSIGSAPSGGVLVFCRTRRRAHWVGAALVRHGVPTGYLHGDRSHAQRTRALEGFRAGRFRVLLATDVAARGLHVEAVRLVVQYDLPTDPMEHVHRIGRAAHGLEGRGGAGEAITFVAPSELARWAGIRAASEGPARLEPVPASIGAERTSGRDGGESDDGSRDRRASKARARSATKDGAAAEETRRSRQSRPIGRGQRPGGGVRRLERPGSE